MSLFIGSQVTIASCSLEHILKSTAESYHRHHLDLVSFSQFADLYVVHVYYVFRYSLNACYRYTRECYDIEQKNLTCLIVQLTLLDVSLKTFKIQILYF